jgi:hypothetical protein
MRPLSPFFRLFVNFDMLAYKMQAVGDRHSGNPRADNRYAHHPRSFDDSPNERTVLSGEGSRQGGVGLFAEKMYSSRYLRCCNAIKREHRLLTFTANSCGKASDEGL